MVREKMGCGGTDGQWDTYDIADVLKGTEDNYNKKEYKIWRYVTENTIPGIPQQKQGFSPTRNCF